VRSGPDAEFPYFVEQKAGAFARKCGWRAPYVFKPRMSGRSFAKRLRRVARGDSSKGFAYYSFPLEEGQPGGT